MKELEYHNWIEWANTWNRDRDHYNRIRKNIEKRKKEFSEKMKILKTIGD